MEGSDDDFSISSVEGQMMPAGSNTYSSRQWGHGSGTTTVAGLAGEFTDNNLLK